MSVVVKGKLPPGERNGIADLADRLNEDPHQRLLCVIELDVHAIKTLVDREDDGQNVVELKLSGIEVIDGSEKAFVEAVARRARENRTGVRSLPGFGTVLDDEGATDRIIREYAERGIDEMTGEVGPPAGEPPADDGAGE